VNFEEPAEYIPMSWAVFYSASGGNNDVFGNRVNVDHTAPSSKARGAAFYIAGATNGYGGRFFNNRITSNTPAVWIAGQYGGAVNTELLDNIFIKAPGTTPNYVPVRMGFDGNAESVAKHIRFRSNEVVNDTFSIQQTNANHTYAVYGMLRLSLVDRNGNPMEQQEVCIHHAANGAAYSGKTNEKGELVAELPMYISENGQRTTYDRYIINTGGEQKGVLFKGDTAFTFRLKAKNSGKNK